MPDTIKICFISAVILLLVQNGSVFAQLNEAGDYGTFENEGDDAPIREYHAKSLRDGSDVYNVYNYCQRSDLQAKTGDWSLLVNIKHLQRGHLHLPFSRNKIIGDLDPSKFYVVSAWFYFPLADVGFGFNDRTNNFNLFNVYSDGTNDGYVIQRGCDSNTDDVEGFVTFPFDRWYRSYGIVNPYTGHIKFDLDFNYYRVIYESNRETNTVFFMDDIQVHEYDEYPDLIDNPSVSSSETGFSVTLDPKGAPSPLTYVYKWSDLSELLYSVDGQSKSKRDNLQKGNYSVMISSGVGCYYKNFNYTLKPSTLCETLIPSSGGTIRLDKSSGHIVFRRGDSDCVPAIQVGCIQGKIEVPQLNNVVSASAQTYASSWSYDYLSAKQGGGNVVERGVLGKWRPRAAYSFNKNSLSNDKNYNSGRYSLVPFNWQNEQLSSDFGWIKDNEVAKYSPHGDVVEERDALNIASAAKFGYHDNVPYLIAKNAVYNDVLFESFENIYKDNNVLEDGTPVIGNNIDKSTGHTGARSYRLQANAPFTTRSFSRSGALETKGFLIRFWAKGSGLGDAVLLARLMENGQSVPRTMSPFTRRARAGEWSLWEASVAPGAFSLVNAGNTFTVVLTSSSAADIWIDDVRIQPQDAEMTCYVYDPRTLKLLATLDDQHFALLYQYNSEGQLVRKMVETERGVKTVQETQYNLPKTTKQTGE